MSATTFTATELKAEQTSGRPKTDPVASVSESKHFRAVKLSFRGDRRRLPLSERASKDDEAPLTVDELSEHIRRIFGKELGGDNFKIRYEDEDEDMVLVCNNDELLEAFLCAKDKSVTLTLEIQAVKKKQQQPALSKDDEIAQRGNEDPEHSNSTDFPEVETKETKNKESKSQPRTQQNESKQRQFPWDDFGGSPFGPGGPQFGPGSSPFSMLGNIKGELKSILRDPAALSALQEALAVAADQLLQGVDVPTVLETSVSTQPSLARNPGVQRILPLLKMGSGFVDRQVVLEVVLELQSLLREGKLQKMSMKDLKDRMMFRIRQTRRRSRESRQNGDDNNEDDTRSGFGGEANPMDNLMGFLNAMSSGSSGGNNFLANMLGSLAAAQGAGGVGPFGPNNTQNQGASPYGFGFDSANGGFGGGSAPAAGLPPGFMEMMMSGMASAAANSRASSQQPTAGPPQQPTAPQSQPPPSQETPSAPPSGSSLIDDEVPGEYDEDA
mmetsp:Transcript_10057/g.18292  ORF Transcript_10057/g.18292 Transcript_10057/m.18292 type:complete len:498 (-) Transcript_10057:289-1782(-)|eukprot:CAMPEP_0197534432 /NCGR_PEP_ID=MMETSP1318-20131121/47122_1 /TAXON_ID=552666 /ORGANISM="Partenskyella glossopodia, Strain RCC365" /LENGTH=497 /DNA_ID=CAMNT_0043091695 /DNA_START=155 /DNA_END=1648 /DNA_ORIENTATION=+